MGEVQLWGIDGSLGYQIIDGLSLYGSASYNHSEVQNDIPGGAPGVIVPTAGKELVETPNWTFGTRIEYTLGPVTLGVQGKYVGERWATDINDESASSYTVFDADARYEFAMFGFESFVQLNVINVTDKEYLGSISTSRFAAGPPLNTLGAPQYSVAAPRTFQLSVNATF